MSGDTKVPVYVECLRKVLIGSRNGFDYDFTLERNQCSIK